MTGAQASAFDGRDMVVQAVVVLPAEAVGPEPDQWELQLFRRVAGVPLLVRVLATAAKAGVESVLLVRPGWLPEPWLRDRLHTPLLEHLSLTVVEATQPFDPADAGGWSALSGLLAPVFLWLPWNYVMPRGAMIALIAGPPRAGMPGTTAPMVLEAGKVLHRAEAGPDTAQASAVEPEPAAAPIGVAVVSRDSARQAERLLVGGSGKPSDGIYSNFNRRLCRPLVRWIVTTPITANMVTYAGVPVVLLSAYWYAQGYWAAYVAGALLNFVSVLLDEVDGMIARTKFQDSAYGCWLETVTDYASYLFLWVGMSVGLTRQFHTPVWMMLGGLTIAMSLLIFVVLIRMRQAVATDSTPDQFHYRFVGGLDADAANPVSRGIRKISFLAKRGVLAHYVVLFSVFGLLPLFVGLAAFGSVVTFAIVLYAGRFFFRRPTMGHPM